MVPTDSEIMKKALKSPGMSEFLDEQMHPFMRQKYSFLFQQFLSDDQKQQAEQLYKPNCYPPSYEAYSQARLSILKTAQKSKKNQTLVMEFFVGRGMMANNKQVILTNEFCQATKFYRFIDAENFGRIASQRNPNCYFLSVFAGSREKFDRQVGMSMSAQRDTMMYKQVRLDSKLDAVEESKDTVKDGFEETW